MLPRPILVIALCTLSTALPTPSDVSGVLAVVNQNVEDGSIYSSLPLFQIFKPIIDMFPNFSDIGPKIEAGDKYTNIIVKAKDYKVEDLSVKIKGKLVVLQGSRTTEAGDRDLTSEFLYTTSLPSNINTKDVFAKYYSDGYLVVTSPNEGAKGVYEDRDVPIVFIDEKFMKPKPIKPEENVNVVPVVPVEPVKPVKPIVSDVPVVPEVSVAPVKPVAPEVPVVSEVPASSDAPVVPEVPVASDVPVVQEVPVASDVPVVPEVPVAPEASVAAVPEPPVSPETNSELESLQGTNEIGTTPADITAQPTVPESTTDVKELEKETVEDVESTTPYIEVVTLGTTPYVANEISDLVPVSEGN